MALGADQHLEQRPNQRQRKRIRKISEKDVRQKRDRSL